jgi:hypothetical protein
MRGGPHNSIRTPISILQHLNLAVLAQGAKKFVDVSNLRL